MKSNRSRVLFVVVSIAALASLRAVDSGPGRDSATKALSVFSEVFSLTRGNYVDAASPPLIACRFGVARRWRRRRSNR